MPTVWRITTARFTASAFTGEGARRYGGRWNPQGWEVVYTAQSPALALLELLVQDDPLRANYVLLPAVVPDDVACTVLSPADLPVDWRTLDQRPALQILGQQWLQQGRSAVLQVPSAVLPAECNFLLNPRHPDFARIAVGSAQSLAMDTRLLRNLMDGAPALRKPYDDH